VETGLGLCCEEAARLILSQRTPVTLEYSGTKECEDEIITLRDQVLILLQNRTLSVAQRVAEMLLLCSATPSPSPMGEWASLLLELERLDPSWTDLLISLKEGWDTADYAGFSQHMALRQSEYEQLLVYLIYRHMANAPDFTSLAARASFADLIYRLLYTLGAIIWTKTGKFSFEDQVELVRLFSSEIEYSDENLYLILDSLTPGE
jgi:lysine-N-methylase